MGLPLKLRLYAYALGLSRERRDVLIQLAVKLVDDYIKQPQVAALARQLREQSRSRDEARFLCHAVDRRLSQRGLNHSTRSSIFSWLLQQSEQESPIEPKDELPAVPRKVLQTHVEKDASKGETGITDGPEDEGASHDGKRPLAGNLCESVARKVITDLQNIEDGLLGDESGLINLWEEICVQEQSERSLAWAAYDETVKSLIEAHLEDLSHTQRRELWDEARQNIEPQSAGELDHRRTHALSTTELLTYLAERFVYVDAANFSNSRTAGFWENQ